MCPLGPGSSSATSATGQIHLKNTIEPAGDNSSEVLPVASPGLSAGFPRQPDLPMGHADGRGPRCSRRRGGLAGWPK